MLNIYQILGRTSLFVFLLYSFSAVAQDVPVGTESPYQTVFTHLFYLQPDSYDPGLSATTFDASQVPDSATRVELAIKLKQILDGEGLFVDMDLLPKDASFIDSATNKAIYTLFPTELPEIYLINKGSNWYYSSATVNAISELHQKIFPFGSTFLMNLFPEFGNRQFLGLALWQYIGFILIALIGFLLYWIIQQLLRPFIRRVLRKWLTEDEKQIKLIDLIASALSIVVIIQLILYVIPMLLLPIKTGAFIVKILRILQTIAIALVIVRAVNFFIFHMKSLVDKTDNRMDDQLLPLLKKIIHLVVIVGAIIHALSLLDVNVTALIAGVSLGGLAIALAAQDAVKNFIGSIMIFADRPFQIGDYIIGGGIEGEVKEVGFRTTRIKSLDTSIIAVPNGTLANMNIQNLGARSMRLFNTVLTVTYDAQPDQLQHFIADLKQLILDHPSISNENYYVHLKEMGESSINIMFRAYLDVPGYADELKTKEELLFHIMELAKKNGLSFAFPSRTIYTINENDQKPLDE